MKIFNQYTMSLVFFVIGMFFLWYSGFDFFKRDPKVAYAVFSALIISIMAGQFWEDFLGK